MFLNPGSRHSVDCRRDEVKAKSNRKENRAISADSAEWINDCPLAAKCVWREFVSSKKAGIVASGKRPMGYTHAFPACSSQVPCR